MNEVKKSYLRKRLKEIAERKINEIQSTYYNPPSLIELLKQNKLILSNKKTIIQKIEQQQRINLHGSYSLSGSIDSNWIFVNFNEIYNKIIKDEKEYTKNKYVRIAKVQTELVKMCDNIMFSNDEEALSSLQKFEAMVF